MWVNIIAPTRFYSSTVGNSFLQLWSVQHNHKQNPFVKYSVQIWLFQGACDVIGCYPLVIALIGPFLVNRLACAPRSSPTPSSSISGNLAGFARFAILFHNQIILYILKSASYSWMHVRIAWATFKKYQNVAPTSGDLIGPGGALEWASSKNSPRVLASDNPWDWQA